MTDLVFNVPRELRRGGKAGVEDESVGTGLDLIQLMCRRFDLEDLGNSRMLDMGCGVKLVQAFLQDHLPIGSYVGVDVFPEQIEFLRSSVSDPRFSFHLLNSHNEMYNPQGEPLSAAMTIPEDEGSFDIICLFSVFTHLAPHDYVAMLEMLRKYVKPNGKLIFSLFLYENTPGGLGFIDKLGRKIKVTKEQVEAWPGPPDFKDWDPRQPLKFAIYSRENAIRLVDGTGWEIESINDPEEVIQHYMICRPV